MPSEHSASSRSSDSSRSLLGLALLIGLLVSSCLGKHAWTLSAPPIAQTIARVERDDTVAQQLGSPVSVSRHVGKRMRRDLLLSLIGKDKVSVLTKVQGSRGEAWLDLEAVNYDGQGWAGRFSIATEGRNVLSNGGYRVEGARTLLRGEFAPDGSPITHKPEQP